MNSLSVGIIHARGGSKRIPLKNIKLLGDKPLIAYIVIAALNSKKLNKVVVSTDHPEIIRIAEEYGAEVPFIRPKELAEDVPSEWVTKHAVEFLEKKNNIKIDIAVTMQPTTPFCSGKDIDLCIEKLEKSDFDSVISAVEISERPEWMYYINDNDEIIPYHGKKPEGWEGVAQKLPKLYLPNGGIYATKVKSLFEYDSILGKKSSFYVMSRERSVDIDEPIDFIIAESLLKEFNNEK